MTQLESEWRVELNIPCNMPCGCCRTPFNAVMAAKAPAFGIGDAFIRLLE